MLKRCDRAFHFAPRISFDLARATFSFVAGFACLSGCRSDDRRAPATAPVVARHTSASSTHIVREAHAADLKYEIAGMSVAANGFPEVRTRLTNASGEELIVTYEPRRALVHVGSYVRPGRDRAFPARRQLLAPGETMPVEPPAGQWVQVGSDRQIELMVPARLPPGHYRVWVTFIVGDPHSNVLETERVDFEAK